MGLILCQEKPPRRVDVLDRRSAYPDLGGSEQVLSTWNCHTAGGMAHMGIKEKVT